MNAMTHNQEVSTQQNALQAAMLKASKDMEKATPITVNTLSKELQSVIGRVTVLGEHLLFIVDTHTKDDEKGERIKYWTHGSNALRDAPAEFYKQSKPLDKESTQKLVMAYGKAMKVQHLVVRQRLVKETAAQRQDDGSISKEAQEAWKEATKSKMKAAFNKALDDAFAAM